MIESPATPETKPAYQPTAEQLARQAALRRYNWLAVYGPLIVLSITIVAVGVAMVWLSVVSPENRIDNLWYRTAISAGADLVIIFLSLMAAVMCLILPIAAGAWYILITKQKEFTLVGWLQLLLWRLEGMLNKVQASIRNQTPKAKDAIVLGRGRLAFIGSLLQRIRHLFTGPSDTTAAQENNSE